MRFNSEQLSDASTPTPQLTESTGLVLSDRLFDALPIGILLCDRTGSVVRYNQYIKNLCTDLPDPATSGTAFWAAIQLNANSADPGQGAASIIDNVMTNGITVRDRNMILSGSALPVTFGACTLLDETGICIGAIVTLVETAQRDPQARTHQHPADVISSSNDAIVTKDLLGIITSWNTGAERLFGYSTEEAIGKSIMMLIPSDRQNEEAGILRRIRQGERVEHYDTIRQRKDGMMVEVSVAVSPVTDTSGAIIGASKIARDISDRTRIAERQSLLLREMSHRIRNLFALIGGVVTLSARFALTPKELADAVRARVAALAQTHDLTMPTFDDMTKRNDRKTSLHALMQTIASPYNDIMPAGEDRVTIAGPEVPVGGSAVTSVALLLHEFMTNATKYGALSAPAGHIEITWTISNGSVDLIWRESGGPRIGAHRNANGFGTFLANATVTGQLGGTVTYDWAEPGLTVRLTLPLDRLAT